MWHRSLYLFVLFVSVKRAFRIKDYFSTDAFHEVDVKDEYVTNAEDKNANLKVEDKEIEVFDENLDKIEVFDVEECEETHVNMKLIENENVRDDLENINAVESEENKSKVVDKSVHKTNEMSDDKTDGSPVKVNDDQKMCSEVLGGDGTDDKVVKGMNTLTIIPLLQVLLVLMLHSVKTLQEQSLLIARLSNLSQPGISNPFQSLASGSQCSCLTQSRMYCKATAVISEMVTSITSLGVMWCEQVWRTFKSWKENVILSISDFVTDEDFVKQVGL